MSAQDFLAGMKVVDDIIEKDKILTREMKDKLLNHPAYSSYSIDKKTFALDKQEGGDHYSSMDIQPAEYILANSIPYIEGCVIKYVSRWRHKGGIQDLEKARHCLDILIEHEQKVELRKQNPLITVDDYDDLFGNAPFKG